VSGARDIEYCLPSTARDAPLVNTRFKTGTATEYQHHAIQLMMGPLITMMNAVYKVREKPSVGHVASASSDNGED
jgi:hypothetical protein